MTPREYLEKVLETQNLAEDSKELKDLRALRAEVETHLRDDFGTTPNIRYGGSKAKGTLNKDSYDLDIICYFPRDDEDAGGTIEKIYNNVKATLEKHYYVEPKTSALRIKSKDKVDLHVDVVPGRFVDGDDGDSYLYRAKGEKNRLKTNLDTHISHVKDSGVTDAIRLIKLWRTRNSVPLKTFALELIVISILDGSTAHLDYQVRKVLETLRDDTGSVTIKDPANPDGNDLSEIWNDSIRAVVASYALSTLQVIDRQGWEAVFGKLPETEKVASRVEALRAAASAVAAPARPWCKG